jgi:hypothetical protein
MEAVRTSETSVYSNETTRRYMPEGSNLHLPFVRSKAGTLHKLEIAYAKRESAYNVITSLELRTNFYNILRPRRTSLISKWPGINACSGFAQRNVITLLRFVGSGRDEISVLTASTSLNLHCTGRLNGSCAASRKTYDS